MPKKLFVGGLAWGTDDAGLRQAFEAYGSVTEAKVVMDRDTGRSKGFGFVSYTEDASAEEAKRAMNGAELGGRTIRVDFAIDISGKLFFDFVARCHADFLHGVRVSLLRVRVYQMVVAYFKTANRRP